MYDRNVRKPQIIIDRHSEYRLKLEDDHQHYTTFSISQLTGDVRYSGDVHICLIVCTSCCKTYHQIYNRTGMVIAYKYHQRIWRLGGAGSVGQLWKSVNNSFSN